MNPEKLYNVNSLDEWEELVDGATDADCRTAIIILTDYLRWIPEGLQAQVPQGAEGLNPRAFISALKSSQASDEVSLRRTMNALFFSLFNY